MNTRRADAMGWPERLAAGGDRIAIEAEGDVFSFSDLDRDSNVVAARLKSRPDHADGTRVAFLVPPGYRYVAILFGIWKAGGVGVPLAVSHPRVELEHVVSDSGSAVVVASADLAGRLSPSGTELLDAGDLMTGDGGASLGGGFDPSARALIIYTSGSTGKPKGVVWRHRNIEASITMMTEAWRWTASDRTLLVLPLHHVHGLVNVVLTSLWNQAVCEMLPRFDAARTLDRLASGDLTVFMAVPTVYRRLISAYDGLDPASRRRASEAMSAMRLMVSGSAALPVPTLERWREISSHTLLERYGMTEIGMALTNPYDGPRIPGAVGGPFPGVDLRLVDPAGHPVPDGAQGEIEVRSPAVFDEYWGRPEETAASFRDGWFRTGDAAVVDDGAYRILGRMSVDIIKSGGEKVSALEIEDVLRDHPLVGDCAVVGVPDPEWGEQVAAAIVPAAGEAPDLDSLQAFSRSRLAPEKLPRRLVVLDEMPRNAMGKVVKPRVREFFERP